MLNCREFYNLLIENDIDFFTGVPDSTLKDICGYITDNTPKDKNIITANEGNAVGLASGYHLATGKFPLVYMQNSGLGNAVNPLVSLADPLVYSIPMLVMIGWRGEPGTKDEPQHAKQGKITLKLLEAMDIAYSVLPQTIQEAETVLKHAIEYMKSNESPYAIVVSKGTFETYKMKTKSESPCSLTREEAIKIIVSEIDEKDIIVSTTGMASRELFEYREELKQGHERDFLTVGSMGHSSHIALGIALSKPQRNVYCIDGDGSLIMHMGALAIIGDQSPKNFKHIVINNGAHDSVGGQPTVAFNLNIPSIAKLCGYKYALCANTEKELKEMVKVLNLSQGPALLEVRVQKGARKDLGRPTIPPVENKKAFMEFLAK